MAKKKSFQISNALSDGLEETITSAHSYSGEIRVDVIPLKKIEIDPENPRDLKITFNDLYNGLSQTDPLYENKAKEISSLNSIANSIKDQGIINPIIVYKHGEKYRLIAGERRTLASILAGKGDILARILDARPNELKISLLQWIENIERKDLSLGERLNNLEKIIHSYAESKKIAPDQVSITELSNLIGCVKSHALNYKAVLSANNKLRQLIDDNKIKNLEKAAFIANLKSEEVQQQAINACLNGATLQKLKVTVEQIHITQRTIKKVISNRGRQAVSVQLGGTKNIEVVRLIFDSIMKNAPITDFEEHFQTLDWSDYKSVTHHFKRLLQKLEELTV